MPADIDTSDNCEGNCIHKQFHAMLMEATAATLDMPAIERVYIVAQFLGTVVAYQDDTSITSERIQATIEQGIEEGNIAGIAALMTPSDTAH